MSNNRYVINEKDLKECGCIYCCNENIINANLIFNCSPNIKKCLTCGTEFIVLRDGINVSHICSIINGGQVHSEFASNPKKYVKHRQ